MLFLCWLRRRLASPSPSMSQPSSEPPSAPEASSQGVSPAPSQDAHPTNSTPKRKTEADPIAATQEEEEYPLTQKEAPKKPKTRLRYKTVHEDRIYDWASEMRIILSGIKNDDALSDDFRRNLISQLALNSLEMASEFRCASFDAIMAATAYDAALKHAMQAFRVIEEVVGQDCDRLKTPLVRVRETNGN